MAEQTRTIQMLLPGGTVEEARVSLAAADGACRLSLTHQGRTLHAEASDYFEALCHIREVLEQDGTRLLCYGASRNVYPSGMARDMGAGLRAYRLTPGRHSSGAELQDIFATGPDVLPATVEEQRRYRDEWLVSIGVLDA
ncbi:MAG TPA: hypothetical protein VF584_06605 [Longimicrobium sp.]|jgi:hypothetical protein